MRKHILFLLLITLTIMAGCVLMTHSISRDIPYTNIDIDKAFDCAVSAAQSMGFTRTQSNRRNGTFTAIKSTGTLSAKYQADVIIDKSAILVKLHEVDAAVPADLNKMIDAFYAAFQKHCGK